MSRPARALPGGLLSVWLGLLAACASAPPEPPAAPQPLPVATAAVTVRLIAFNDFHGQLDADGLVLPQPGGAPVPAGGAAALAGLVQALRTQVPHSMLLSSGDAVGATPLASALGRHEPTLEILNRLGVDLAIPGNHEFDAGWPELQRLVQGGCAAPDPVLSSCVDGPWPGTRFPWVAANLRQPVPGAPFPASVVREFDGVRVGFIGAVTRSTPGMVRAAGLSGLRFDDEAEAINREAAALQAQGVHTLVALVHEGGELADEARLQWNDERCPGAHGPLFEINRRLTPAIDVLLSAHTHQGYRCVIDRRPVMQAGSQGRGLSVVDLTIDRASGAVRREATRSRNLVVLQPQAAGAARRAVLDDTPAPWRAALEAARPDPEIAAAVARHQARVAPLAERPVGQLGGDFTRQGDTDSALGRLVADAQLAATRAEAQGGAQVALTNPGGLRADLRCRGTPPCPVSFGQAFAAQPFGNTLVVMTLTGAELKAVLEAQQHRREGPPRWLQPSQGLSYRWQRSAPPGERVQDLRLNGRRLSADEPVRLVVNSYLADGGDGFTLLRQGRDRVGGPSDLQALVEALAQQPRPDLLPRITLAD